jgi:hypothetical protein
MGGDADDKPPGPRAGNAPSAPAQTASDDPRIRAAWRSWLSALGTDSQAAIATALAYDSLSPEGRNAWLDVLETDCVALAVPKVALYAPLLAVEHDGERQRRMQAVVVADTASRRGAASPLHPYALRGVGRDGVHACMVVAPVYLDFVQVLCCRYTPEGGILAATLDPLRHARELAPMRDVEGVAVEPTPLPVVVEELAHAILADNRGQRPAPDALRLFAHLFAPEIGGPQDAEPDAP